MNTGLATDLIATSYSILKFVPKKAHVKMMISVFVSVHAVVSLYMSGFFIFFILMYVLFLYTARFYMTSQFSL